VPLVMIVHAMITVQAAADPTTEMDARLTRLEHMVANIPTKDDLRLIVREELDKSPHSLSSEFKKMGDFVEKRMLAVQEEVGRLARQIEGAMKPPSSDGQPPPSGEGAQQQQQKQQGPVRSVEENIKLLMSEQAVEQREGVLIDLLKHSFPNATDAGEVMNKAGAWSALIAVGKSNIANDVILGPLLSLVEVFSSYDTFRKSLEQVGALPLVTDAIVAKAKTPAMIRVTAAAFANLVISDMSRSEVDSHQITKVLVEGALELQKKDMTDELTQAAVSECYRAMRNLAYHNGPNAGAIAVSGGVEAAQAIISEAKPGSQPGSDVLIQALGLVLNLAIDHEVNTQKLYEANVIADIVRIASELFGASAGPLDEALLGHVLDTLLILSTQPSGQKGLAQAGAAPTLAQGINLAALKSQSVLSRAVVAILGNMATEATQSKLILEGQGIPAVLEAMKLHHSDVQMQEAATGALRNFCVTEAGRAHAATAGGIEAVVDAMRTHAELPRVVQNGISALINLSQNSNKNKASMRRSGVIPLVKGALTAHPGAQQLQEVGLFFLQELGVKSI